MITLPSGQFGSVIESLKAAAEPSRFRILTLLSRGDLNVSDITEILNQSQPRVSRHLKLLMDGGLVERYQEGAWAFFSIAQSGKMREFVNSLTNLVGSDDPVLLRDLERLEEVRHKRRVQAERYFSANAKSWTRIRSLHAPDQAVEEALQELIGDRPFQAMLDLGTGTGRMLELFSPLYRRAVGIDLSRDMLSIARVNLDKITNRTIQIRQGDVYAPPVERGNFDLVTIHQVLHYLEEPEKAIKQAALALRPGGRLAVVDFAPHTLEFLREKHAHFRLGIADEQISQWFGRAELDLVETREIAPKNDDAEQLIVKIWLGQDRRVQIADDGIPNAFEEVA